MMKRLIMLSVVAVAFWMWNPAYGQMSTDVAEGARVWANNCTRCHNARSPMERYDRQWTTIVAHMRARANLTRTEARLVTAYLQAINAPEVATTPPRPEIVPTSAKTQKDVKPKQTEEKKTGGGSDSSR